MPFYKSLNNGVHYLSEVDIANGGELLLPAGSVEITDAEAEILQAPPPPSPQEIIAQYTTAVQLRLDVFFQTRGYDGILSAATYATSSVLKFQAEGQYAVEARDATWAKCYEILAAVEGGTSPMPTEAELLAELPALVWPK